MNYQQKFFKYNNKNKNKLFGGNLEKYTVHETDDYEVCIINAINLTEELKTDIIENLKLCFPMDNFQNFKKLNDPACYWFLLIAKRKICVEKGRIASLLCYFSPSESNSIPQIEKVCIFINCRGKFDTTYSDVFPFGDLYHITEKTHISFIEYFQAQDS